IAAIATLVIVLCGLVVSWAARNLRSDNRHSLGRLCARVATMGYALPGTVLAIGLLLPFNVIDNVLSWVGGFFSDSSPRLLLMGSSTALVCAYVIRFLAISVGGIESGLARIPPSLEQASRLLGETPTSTLRRVHLPLLRPA